MRNFLLSMVVGIAFVGTARAASDIDTIATANGTCVRLMMDGQAVPCSNMKGITYFHYRHGTTMIVMGTNDGRLIGFAGDHDSQPSAGDYRLSLSRINIKSAAMTRLPVQKGFCQIKMTPDGFIWNSVICVAHTPNGEDFSLEFRGDGSKVNMTHAR